MDLIFYGCPELPTVCMGVLDVACGTFQQVRKEVGKDLDNTFVEG
jgi:hypothetical protein